MAHTDFRNIEALLSQFDVMATPYIEVYEGKQKKFDFIEDDLDGARNFLSQQLEAIKFFGNTALFRIAFYREATEKGKLLPENLKGSNTFKLMEYEEAANVPYWKQKAIGAANSNPEFEELKQMLLAQQSQINALLEDPDEIEEAAESVGAYGGLLGALTPLLQNPEVQQVIAGKIIGFINKILPDNQNNNVMENKANLAGLTENDAQRINNALAVLLSAGMSANDFEKLAALANDPTQFQFYLSMLRK